MHWPDLAVRDGDWKLLCRYDGAAPELYDLKTDRGETTNLALQQPAVAKRLTALVLAWHQSLPPDRGASIKIGQKGKGSKKAPGIESP